MDINAQDEIPVIIDANGDGKCDIPLGFFTCTIENEGDNHFGYVGFENKKGMLIDDGAMNIVVDNWKHPRSK